MSATTKRLPVYFISHGGGPWPWMREEMGGMYDRLEASLRALPQELGAEPRAVLVVSGHWEEAEPTLMASARPPMLYDYGGFPRHTYQIRYDAPGSPELARRAQALLEGAGLRARLDEERGFDHGTFVPLAVMYPDARVPVVELSVLESYDPEQHLRMGRALAPLRDEGVLILGSGLSYHNLRRFDERAREPSREFDRWLTETVTAVDPGERAARLRAWDRAPSARVAHPREDHLVPLMVAVGAAESEKGSVSYHEDAFLGGIAVTSFRLG